MSTSFKHFPNNSDWTVATSNANSLNELQLKVKVKWFRYRPGVAQRVGRGIALLFHDRGTRRGWAVSSTPRPHFTPRKDPVTILQEAVWALGPAWKGGKSRPHRDSISDRPAHRQSLYRLSYPAYQRTTTIQNNGIRIYIALTSVHFTHAHIHIVTTDTCNLTCMYSGSRDNYCSCNGCCLLLYFLHCCV